jgi:hypothetical protein
MAKITLSIPQPKEPYTVENFNQINRVLLTLQNQLNTTYLSDIKDEENRRIWYSMKSGDCC